MSILAQLGDSEPLRISFQIEPMIDNYTGRFYEGAFGDYPLSGGLGQSLVITGRGNSIKTGQLLLCMLRILLRYPSSAGNIHDTEDSLMGVHRVEELAEGLTPELIDAGTLWDLNRFKISDSSAKGIGTTTKWWVKLTEVLEARIKKNVKDDWLVTPFLDPTIKDKKVFIKVLKPLVAGLDSISKANIDAIDNVESKTAFDSSEQNILAARDGLYKTRMIRRMPRLAALGGVNWIITAHMGDQLNFNPMDTPEKKLAFIDSKVKFKGMPEVGTFLSNVILYSNHLKKLQNQKDRTPEYPLEGEANAARDPDLLELHVMTLRSKVGATGIEWTYVVSQSTGFNIPLSHYHNLKKAQFGFTGVKGDVWFSLELYPECKISRSSIRGKVESDPLLVRALEITVGLFARMQTDQRFRRKMMKIGSLTKLKEAIEARGYSWNELVLTSRDFWSEDHYTNPHRALSIMDLVNMANGEYIPYWLQSDFPYKVKSKSTKSSNESTSTSTTKEKPTKTKKSKIEINVDEILSMPGVTDELDLMTELDEV